ncbi:MAG TPA: hypothetical protein V6D02_11495 [Candidatus Obscuribacterales bacterium]
MTYQNKLQPWCIVRQLPEMKRVIVDRFRHYPEADARAQFLRQQTPNSKFLVLFAPDVPTVAEAAAAH